MGSRVALLLVLEEITSETSTHVLVFILTVIVTDPGSLFTPARVYLQARDPGSVAETRTRTSQLRNLLAFAGASPVKIYSFKSR